MYMIMNIDVSELKLSISYHEYITLKKHRISMFKLMIRILGV